MERDELKKLLGEVASGKVGVDRALRRLRSGHVESLEFATLDMHRALRRGFPEVILGEGKSREQVVAIAERLAAQSDRLLITRVDVDIYRAVKERLPDARYQADARAVTLDRSREPRWQAW